MKISIYQPLAIHEIGKRDNQEDSIYPLSGEASVNDRLFIVCDGMGGHEHGEVASQTFSQGLAKYFKGKVSSSDSLDDNTLKEAIEYAYQELDKKDDGAFKKMGTTLTLIYMHRGGVTCAHIGDSRIYHIRPGKGLLYVSRDHSLVFDLYQSGEISYDEMKTSPQKNIITRAVQPGKDNRVRADIIHITDVQSGDYFYLCSDGMLEEMENEELLALLSSDASDEKKRQKLIAETVDNKDNHSAYIIHVESVKSEDGDEKLVNEEPTARCNALNIRPVLSNDEISNTMENDVQVIVNNSPQPEDCDARLHSRSKKRLFLPVLFFACLLLIGGFVVYSFMGNDTKEPDVLKAEPNPPSADSSDTTQESDHEQPIIHRALKNQEKPSQTVEHSSQSRSDKHSSNSSKPQSSSDKEAEINQNPSNADQQQAPQETEKAQPLNDGKQNKEKSVADKIISSNAFGSPKNSGGNHSEVQEKSNK